MSSPVSADDWTLTEVVWIFTVAILVLGLAAAFAGKWLEKVGPRTVGIVAAFCWGGGYIVGSLGIYLNQVWLLYLGYGVIGGCGLGLGYVSPVSTLIRWFPTGVVWQLEWQLWVSVAAQCWEHP